jgi:tetratricopeptide (TPR) repeat protein
VRSAAAGVATAVAVVAHERAAETLAAGRPGGALPDCLRALELLERDSPASLELAAVLNTLGAIREGLSELVRAEDAFARAAGILTAVHADEERALRLRVRAMAGLAGVYRTLGRLADAGKLLLAALQLADATLDPVGPERTVLMNDLAIVYKHAGRFEESERLYWRALAAVEAARGPDHPEAAAIWHNLGGLEHARGRYAEGEGLRPPRGRDPRGRARPRPSRGRRRRRRARRARAGAGSARRGRGAVSPRARRLRGRARPRALRARRHLQQPRRAAGSARAARRRAGAVRTRAGDQADGARLRPSRRRDDAAQPRRPALPPGARCAEARPLFERAVRIRSATAEARWPARRAR